MKKFAPQSYWESIYGAKESNKKKYWIKVIFRKIKKILGKNIENYSEFLIWEILFPKYLPARKDNQQINVVEVGSAPGKNLVRFNRDFSYEPYGIEYTKDGFELNKKNFLAANLKVENIINEDFFADIVQKKYKDFFDVVFSKGFIEHFDDLESVILSHINILKKSGTLVVIIPNLSGLNYYLAKFFNPDTLKMHNLKIMDKQVFYSLFNKFDLDLKYCDYIGVFNFGLFNTNSKSKRLIHRACLWMQYFLNNLFRFLKIKEYKYFSPYLIYIGIKK